MVSLTENAVAEKSDMLTTLSELFFLPSSDIIDTVLF